MSKQNDAVEILNAIGKNTNEKKTKNHLIKDYIIIDINSCLFGLQLEYLREVFELSDKDAIVPIPCTPPYVLGIISVREEIIPVLSLLTILGINKATNRFNKILVLEERIKVAVPFTEIIDLKGLEIAGVREVKNASLENSAQFINQEFDNNGQTISIIDMIKLFSSEYCV